MHLNEEGKYLEVAGGMDSDIEVYTNEEDARPRCTPELRKKHDATGLKDNRSSGGALRDSRSTLVMTTTMGGTPARRTLASTCLDLELGGTCGRR